MARMIPPFDYDGDLPPGMHRTTWPEFKERFCAFASSDRRVDLGRRVEQMIEDARVAQVVDRIVFGGSFVTASPGPNDFDCIVVLKPGTSYDNLQPFQRWVADTREASRRYQSDVFVAKADQPTLPVYLELFSVNRRGKRVGLVEVIL